MHKTEKLIEKREIGYYILGGLCGFAINLGVAFLFTNCLHLFYFYSYVIASLVNYTFNFFFHRAVTFSVYDQTAKRASIYYSTNIALGALSLAMVYVLTSILGIQYLLSGVLSTAIIVVINFLISKLLTFRKSL